MRPLKSSVHGRFHSEPVRAFDAYLLVSVIDYLELGLVVHLPCSGQASIPLYNLSMATTAELINSANDLLVEHATLISRVRASQKASRNRLQAIPSPPVDVLNLPLIPSPCPSPPVSPPSEPVSPVSPKRTKPLRPDLPPAKRVRAARYVNYVPEEETIRNDYSQRYVDGGEWPQNWVLGAEPERRFEE